MIEDHGTILGADIRALPVERGWVVRGEEDIQDFAKGQGSRIERDLHDLCMARGTGTNQFISGMLGPSAGVARLDALDAAKLFKDGFQAPEATAAQRGKLSCARGHFFA